MAQIKIPAEFAKQITLLDSIVEKNNSLGADSPLTAWLAEKEIDLSKNVLAGVDAAAQEKLRAQQAALSKTAFETRDEKFSGVMDFIRPGAQALKKFFKPTYGKLADWGLPVTESGRINYPSSFEELNGMADTFFAKLASYGEGKSPLAVFIKTNDVNVAKLGTANTDAADQNGIANKAAKAAENATEKRDLLWANPLKDIHAIAEYLKSIYPTNPRALGEWGFVVDESVGVKKLWKIKLIIGETKVVTGVKVGSIAVNTGKGDVMLYRGKTTAGQMSVLKPGDKMGMVKGYSIITLVNSSTLETGEISMELPE